MCVVFGIIRKVKIINQMGPSYADQSYSSPHTSTRMAKLEFGLDMSKLIRVNLETMTIRRGMDKPMNSQQLRGAGH